MPLLMNMTLPRSDTPSGLSSFFSRFRRVKPNICFVVFEWPDQKKPICYRVYVNGGHTCNFTDSTDLACYLARLEQRMPYIEFYVRSTMKHVIPYQLRDEIQTMLERDIRTIKRYRSEEDGTFLRGRKHSAK